MAILSSKCTLLTRACYAQHYQSIGTGRCTSPDGGLPIAQEVLQHAQAHGGAQILAHADHGQAQHCWPLVCSLHNQELGQS